MQKSSVLLFVLFFGLVGYGFAQATPPTDFYAGKWEILVTGSPRGDVTFLTNLIRKDGTLTGELVEAEDANAKRKITKVEESANKLVLYFESSQGGEVAIDLSQVDNDHLKGQLMNMFEANAQRVKP